MLFEVQQPSVVHKIEKVQQPLRLIRLPEVMRRTGMGRSWIYQRVAAGQFPTPISLGDGGRATAWLEHEVDAFIEGRIAESRGAA